MKEKRDDWKLKKLELEFNSYGEYEGKYTGKVRFQNGEFERQRPGDSRYAERSCSASDGGQDNG